MEKKTIAFVLYPGLTPLDLVGPLQVLSVLPGYEVVVVGQTREPVATDTPVRLAASHTFAEVPDPAVVLVPGGMAPTIKAMTDETLLSYLRRAAANADVVGSVCTGSLILGAAGLLEGREATTHWAFLEQLAALDAKPVRRRWVQDGRVFTAAGVSAGIDLALHLVRTLAGEDVARQVQFGIEYDPEPPFGPLDWAAAPHEFWAPCGARRWTRGSPAARSCRHACADDRARAGVRSARGALRRTVTRAELPRRRGTARDPAGTGPVAGAARPLPGVCSCSQVLTFREPRARATAAPRDLVTLLRRPRVARWAFVPLPLMWLGVGGSFMLLTPMLIDAGWWLSRLGLVNTVLGNVAAIAGGLAAGVALTDIAPHGAAGAERRAGRRGGVAVLLWRRAPRRSRARRRWCACCTPATRPR
ncbi:DJ-1/PfpI family protein [Prauserella flavalba]|uniref:DJ-1/PfpI family protein n=1 Tax=Prauserella flavalba TaxID=1477506 RepID=UPI0036E61748